jgi:hypothetical protein
MTRVPSPRRLLRSPLPLLGAVALAGCGTALATAPSAPTHTSAPTPTSAPTHTTAPAQTARVDRLAYVAAHQYALEVGGSVARQDLHRIAGDARLHSVVRSGSDATLRSYVHGKFASVWSHQHVSRLQILRGSRVVIDEGVPFVVDGPHTVLRSASGRSLVTLRISIQDEIGFVRLMHRNHPIDVVVRGQGPGHVRTSLPAALHVRLPDRGTASIAGRRYTVRTFSRTALGGEPVKIWILARG